MNSEKDLERQLNEMCPAHLPTSVRRNILNEMDGKLNGHRRTFWWSGHRAGLQVALAGALCVTLIVSSHWLSRTPRPRPQENPTILVTNSALLPSLALLESRFAAASQIGINAVPVPRSATLLTNIQIRR
ncbi:MAG TPA: hypothetical protein VL171_18915 [Verrucomicrobiae bacterium]|nr:hypothetical protein [Verrucomicrobiae bacterium]